MRAYNKPLQDAERQPNVTMGIAGKNSLPTTQPRVVAMIH